MVFTKDNYHGMCGGRSDKDGGYKTLSSEELKDYWRKSKLILPMYVLDFSYEFYLKNVNFFFKSRKNQILRKLCQNMA